MGVETVKVNGINFEAYYACEVETDPLGTGDSPTEYVVEIIAIEVGADTQDVQDILPRHIYDEIIYQIIQTEANNG